MQQRGRDRPDITKSLHDDAGVWERYLLQTTSLLHTVHHASAGGLSPSQRSADDDGLAGHNARHGIADLHAVGVHDPGHGLFVRIDIRGEDIDPRADY